MSEATMTATANTTEGASDSSNGATNAQVTTSAQAAQQQQVTDGSASADGTNPPQSGKQSGDQDANSSKTAGAPEKYEFKPADGVSFDGDTITAFSEIAKELNMPQEAAQKILDKVGPVMAKQSLQAIEQFSSQWVEGVQSDKEIGGPKLQENLAVAKMAIEKFGTPELRTLLNETRLGNHPELIRAFYRAGKAISEDNFVAGGVRAAKGSRDPASSLYPNQPH